MACHLPGGIHSANDFWEVLLAGEDLIADNGLTARWQDVPPLDNCMPHAGLLDDITLFDNEYFHISPAEARYIDPQHRQLLMVAGKAFADAGITAASLKGSDTGVFTGISAFDYSMHIMQQEEKYRIDPYLGSGNSLSGASGRISYFYGFHGPCMSIDTACSSSLVALHQGAESLKRNECRVALVSGVNLVLSPYLQASLTEAGMLSPDGRCKAFDDSANGYVRSEGCLSIVLKRLSDAVKDGNRIYACITGSAVAQDGASGGLTVPDPGSQARVIRHALQSAGMRPDEICFVEGHGTGTSLGDPVEAEGLRQVFGKRAANEKLALGSVKSNVGHLEAAAGLAGLMKACLSIYNKKLPSHLHFRKPNHHIDWDNMPFYINQDIHSFENITSRIAGGVSSFGFTGTIAHCIVAACENVPSHTKVQLPAPHFQLKPHWLGKMPGTSAAACYNIRWKKTELLHGGGDIQYVYIKTDNGSTHYQHAFLKEKDSFSLMPDHLESIIPQQKYCLVYDISELQDDTPLEHAYQRLVTFLQQILYLKCAPLSVLFITRHAFSIPGDTAEVAALQYSLTAFIKSASLELNGPVMLVLDTDNQVPDMTFISKYVQQTYYREIAERTGERWYPAITVTGLSQVEEISCDPEGTYLITGGRGSLGAHLAEWMVSKGAGTVIVAGRSAHKSPDNGRIIYRQLDISKEEEVLDLGSWLRKNRKILKGIVHAAGTNSRRLLKEMSVKDIMDVAGPKIQGLQHISNHLPLGQLAFLVSYSSIAAVWGSGMLSHYAAANAWMDAFTLKLRKQGIPAKTINWGPWEGSNMMLETKDSISLLQESGIPAFNAGVIRRNYTALLSPASAQLVYVRLNSQRFISMMELRGPLAFWENLRPAEKDTLSEANKDIDLSRIEDDMKRVHFIEQELGRMVKQILGMAAEEDIDATRSFSDMGMDSILLVKYVQCINDHLGTAVTTNMIFNYPTVSVLSGYMNSLFRKKDITPVVKENRLDNMSDEDVLKMVSEEMQKY